MGERLDHSEIHSGQADVIREPVQLSEAMESLERLRDEAASGVMEPVRRPQAPMDVEDPRGGSEVESPGCRVVARASSRQEMEESKEKTGESDVET